MPPIQRPFYTLEQAAIEMNYICNRSDITIDYFLSLNDLFDIPFYVNFNNRKIKKNNNTCLYADMYPAEAQQILDWYIQVAPLLLLKIPVSTISEIVEFNSFQNFEVSKYEDLISIHSFDNTLKKIKISSYSQKAIEQFGSPPNFLSKFSLTLRWRHDPAKVMHFLLQDDTVFDAFDTKLIDDHSRFFGDFDSLDNDLLYPPESFSLEEESEFSSLDEEDEENVVVVDYYIECLHKDPHWINSINVELSNVGYGSAKLDVKPLPDFSYLDTADNQLESNILNTPNWIDDVCRNSYKNEPLFDLSIKYGKPEVNMFSSEDIVITSNTLNDIISGILPSRNWRDEIKQYWMFEMDQNFIDTFVPSGHLSNGVNSKENKVRERVENKVMIFRKSAISALAMICNKNDIDLSNHSTIAFKLLDQQGAVEEHLISESLIIELLKETKELIRKMFPNNKFYN